MKKNSPSKTYQKENKVLFCLTFRVHLTHRGHWWGRKYRWGVRPPTGKDFIGQLFSQSQFRQWVGFKSPTLDFKQEAGKIFWLAGLWDSQSRCQQYVEWVWVGDASLDAESTVVNEQKGNGRQVQIKHKELKAGFKAEEQEKKMIKRYSNWLIMFIFAFWIFLSCTKYILIT